MLHPGDDADEGHAGALLQVARGRREQRLVAAELVEHEAPKRGAVGVVDQCPRAVEVGEGAAAVDVGDEDDRRPGGVGRAHVRQVGGAQVRLGGAPGAFDEDELVLVEQLPQCRLGDRPERTGPVAPTPRPELVVDPAQDDHLAAVVRLRLHEDRVHPDVRLDAGGERLEVLGDADLTAVDNAGVVRHVLRLERRDANAAAVEHARERGREQALAGRARDALDRERAHRAGLAGTTAIRPATSTTSIEAA